jgi:Zn-dependent protease with chaperone function
MHTQPESAQEHPAGTAPTLSDAAGLGLYLLTLAAEAMLGASARWLLFYLGAATVGAIVPLGLSAEQLAWIAAFGPFLYSAFGLALPGQGRLWRLRLGARRMSSEEREAVLAALELLRSHEPRLNDRARFYVLDDPLPAAAVRGHALILTRGLIESGSLAAVLAHELGHVDSLDGRLTEALQRLVVWADPLGPPNRHGAPPPAEDFKPEPEPSLPWSGLRLLLRLAGGGVAGQLLGPLWSAYWRSREYAADAYAASLGQAEDLAGHLADFHQPFDAPQPGVLFKAAQHPPVALRIERLHEYSMRGGSK